jgi:dihydrodipicolinate synthase/N-acetylneuraminate lyase
VLTATDLRGVYAILPTPSNDDAERWDAVDTVNLEETERLTNQLIADGAAGLIVLGTTGECATITEDEYRAFTDCFLSTVNGRVPTFVGTTTMGTHQTVSRLRFAQEHGATGTMLGLPMWQPCTDDMALSFYETISGAFPELAIMVYGNPMAFRYTFPTEFWAELVKRAPTAICAKFGQAPIYQELLDATAGRINFMPMDSSAFAMASVSWDTLTACWATSASMGPQPSIALMNAILAGDRERAQAISEDIKVACETFLPPHMFPVFGSYNIQLEKIRMATAGYCKPGPIRPPYQVIADEIAEGARENGRRWAELAKKYSA